MMSDPVREIRRYVDRNYGDAISTEEPLYYESQKFWVAGLKSDYPRMIHDDYNKESFVKFLTLKDLGEVRLSDDNIITATPREQLIERLQSRLLQWRERAQEIVLSSSAEELAKLGALKDSIAPIVVVVRYLAGKGRHEITKRQLEGEQRSMLRWMDFLKQIKLLEPTENGFTYSSLFATLEKQTAGNGVEEFVNHVVAYIMKNYYSTIRQVFKVWRFETFLHAATCYYAPSIQAGRMLYSKETSLLALYHKWYSRSYSDLRFSSILQELKNQRVLTERDGYWYGSDEIWSRLQPLIQSIPQEITIHRG